MRRALPLALGIALCANTTAQADWSGFYRSSTPALPRVQAATLTDQLQQSHRQSLPPISAPSTDPQSMSVAAPTEIADPLGRCLAEILRAQERYGIPNNILLGIGLQEAGVSRSGRLTVWPWAVNAAGVGRLFDSRVAAMEWVRARQAAGVQSIDVGCMQINLRWHPKAFRSLDEGFDPAINVDYAARFLRDLYAESGDWMRAAGAYHSRTPEHAQVYLASLRRNVAVANDRIDGFRALAGASPINPTRLAALPDAGPEAFMDPLPAPREPWEHGHWSIGQDDPGGTYGIYSRERLEPVLPNFQTYF